MPNQPRKSPIYLSMSKSWSTCLSFSFVLLLSVILVIIFTRTLWPSPDPELLWKNAVADKQSGRLQDARAGLLRLQRLRPATAREWALLAEISEAEGNSQEALAALRHVPELDPLAPEALYMTGLIERNKNRMRHAESAYRQAISLNPKLIKAHKELIYILGMQFRRHEVDQEFKQLLKLTPLNHHDLFVWCLTHFIVWGPESAANLKSYINADPEDRYSRLALATLLISQPGQENKAEQLLAPLPDEDPEALALRVELKLNQARSEEAVAMLSRTSIKTPPLSRIRGRISLMKGDFEAASQHFQDALTDEPYDRISIAELGKALLLKGDQARAKPYLDRAKQLDEVYRLVNQISKSDQPNQALDLNRLGKACEGAGLVSEARGWFLLSIGLNPLDSVAQRALNRLEGNPNSLFPQ